MIKSYRDLEVYQDSYHLAKQIYLIARRFPNHEQYVIGNQLRRAALSIPLNIAEGNGKKQSSAEFKRFLQIAAGSCNEVEVLLDFIFDLECISQREHHSFLEGYKKLGKQLNTLHKKWV